jgi:hypothetical protein
VAYFLHLAINILEKEYSVKIPCFLNKYKKAQKRIIIKNRQKSPQLPTT